MTDDPHTPSPELVDAFAQLAELTRPKCGACRAPYRCCSAGNCDAAAEMARELYGVDPKPGDGPLPFLGPDGCTLAPHLRPLCTVHVCDQHLTSDPAFADAYYDLRDKAGDLLAEHHEKALGA